MRILETAKFARTRKKLVDKGEIEALKAAILAIAVEPLTGKRLHGELAPLRTYAYSAKGQSRRLIYKFSADEIVLFSFGPRQGIYKE
ncbi:MAG: type II toxin-antitoxin system RelE/ParE family toxin [Candidatus Aminicenantes bacterium]|nr:type II toxin-antitoxin system RelE/ParE family toxin [Candidatus Aminicenantes bacterium]